jgi:hypothetical protein
MLALAYLMPDSLLPEGRSRFSVVFLCLRTNSELVPKFQVALHASHAALQMVTLNISPYTNVTLTFDFEFGLDHPVHGWYGWESPTQRRKKVIAKQRKLKLRGPTPRRTDRLTVGRDITWTWTFVIALQIADPSSRQRGLSTWRRNKVIATQRKVKSGHLLERGPDTKTNWPTDRQSQYNLNLIMYKSECVP